MSGDVHVRFREGGGVRFPSATRRNVYVGSEKAGLRVKASLTQFLTERLKLKVNEAKSAVGRPWERKFLGFSFLNVSGAKRAIAPKALARFKERIRGLTHRTRGRSLMQVVGDLTRYLRGWGAYFGFCETPGVLRDLDGWIRRRLRCYLWRQWRHGRVRYRALRRRGVDHRQAAFAAWRPDGPWCMSRTPTVSSALSTAFFVDRGLHLLWPQLLV